jgi:uncharacterized BrkB/YihY/UPF0761 family membrane protein
MTNPSPKILEWLHKLSSDENGSPSSKRIIGILSSLALIFVLIYSSLHETKPVNDTIVNAVALLAFGCLGLTSVDKFTALKKQIKEGISNNTTTEASETPVENTNN